MCCWITHSGQSALLQTSLTVKWIPVPQTTRSQLILHLFMWWVFILHCLKKVFIFKPLCSLVPYSLDAYVLMKLLSSGNAVSMCLHILHMGSRGLGKIQDRWAIWAGIQIPLSTLLTPVYAQHLSCTCCYEQPGSAFWIATSEVPGAAPGVSKEFSFAVACPSPLPSAQQAGGCLRCHLMPCLHMGNLCLSCPSALFQPLIAGGTTGFLQGAWWWCAPSCTVAAAVLPLPVRASPLLTRALLAFVFSLS